MPTRPTATRLLRELAGSFVTPSFSDDIDVDRRKRVHLSSPLSPHAVRHFREPVVAETVSEEDAEEDGAADEATNIEVESEFDVDVDPVVENLNKTPSLETCFDFNLLLPEKDVFKFILENFQCRKCQARISERDVFKQTE